MKLSFFMLRYNGIPYTQEIIDYIQGNQFDYRIIGVFGIKWKLKETESKLKEIYSHKLNDSKAFQDILNRNKNILVGIICVDYNAKHATPDTHSDNMNTVVVKRYFRTKYGNIMHVSDTEPLAYKEIQQTLGFNRSEIACLIRGSVPTIGLCESNDRLVEVFNKIEDGRLTLWKPAHQ